MNAYELLMSCPDSMNTRVRMALKAIAIGDWYGAACHLHNAAEEGNTEWHAHAYALACEYEEKAQAFNTSECEDIERRREVIDMLKEMWAEKDLLAAENLRLRSIIKSMMESAEKLERILNIESSHKQIIYHCPY